MFPNCKRANYLQMSSKPCVCLHSIMSLNTGYKLILNSLPFAEKFEPIISQTNPVYVILIR